MGLCPWHPGGAESAFPGVVPYQQGDVGPDAGCCLWCLLSDGAACRMDYPEVGLQEGSDNRTGSLRYRCPDVHTGKQDQQLFSGVNIAIPYVLVGIFVLAVVLVLSRIKLPDPRRAHHVSDYLLAGIEGCGYKDQACFFVAYHDDSGWSGCSSNHGVYCGYYGEYGDCIPHTIGMLWGDWNVCVIETPRSSLDKRRIFRKPTFNSLYDPFGSPCRGQKPSGTRGCNRPPVLYLPHLSLPSGRVLTLYPSPKSLP